METVLTRDLIRVAMESIEQAGTDRDPTPVVLEFPTSEHMGAVVRWHPLVALAVAGHICQWWSPSRQQRGPFVVETGWPLRDQVVLRCPESDRGPSLRVLCGGDPLFGIAILELCGHPECQEPAPAGPGSRCPAHFTDPVPKGRGQTYWAEIAAGAWRTRYLEGDEYPQRVASRRAGLVAAAVAAGMDEEEVAAVAGLGGAVVDEILHPEPVLEWTGHPLDGPA
ncbi:hypothetical protein ACIQC7_34885 [Kitasatospora sp. NPDC088556]|uniref:hypothetical protein n=1 Tax=Kitasatospora sp. NPDC088556 TaxID=3364076 RepID=UPI0037FBEDEF